MSELLQSGVKVSIAIDNVTTEASQAFDVFKTRAKLSELPGQPGAPGKKSPGQLSRGRFTNNVGEERRPA